MSTGTQRQTAVTAAAEASCPRPFDQRRTSDQIPATAMPIHTLKK